MESKQVAQAIEETGSMNHPLNYNSHEAKQWPFSIEIFQFSAKIFGYPNFC